MHNFSPDIRREETTSETRRRYEDNIKMNHSLLECEDVD
jgi:hypothetical protein